MILIALSDQPERLVPNWQIVVCVPPDVAHTFSNASDALLRFLNFNSPAGWENYMRELGEAAKAGLLTPEVIGRIASRYDSQAI